MAVERVSIDQARQLFESGEAIPLDARSGSWAKSSVKIPGAVRMPKQEVEARHQELPKEKEIIAYCT